MSGFFKAIGQIAGIVAMVARVIPGGQVIAAIAAGVSVVSTALAAALAEPPTARGSVSQVMIEVEALRPYAMGEGYLGGVRRADIGYGPTTDDVPNPYRWSVDVYSGHGPVESIAPRFDFAVIGSDYNGYVVARTQLGSCPESAAMLPYWSAGSLTEWTSANKMSGCAAIGWNLKFDKKGEKYASGVPVQGAYGKWVKVYDPRLDSTFPGGSGLHRLGDESTYEWSENPALHFATYAFGRYQNGKKVIGVGLPADGIDWPIIAAWANVCDANGWAIFGRVFEPGDRWANLKDMAMAGGADPVFSGGLLSVRYQAPRVVLGTITEADLGEGDISTTKMQPYSTRINTVVPKFVDPDSNWELMSLQKVSFDALIEQDGEEKSKEWPFNLVKDARQAAQLGAYRILDAREESPIELPLKPEWRHIRPGDAWRLEIPSLGISTDAVAIKRTLDTKTLCPKVTFMAETPSKHAAALGTVGVPGPGYPTGSSTGDRDSIAWRLRQIANGVVLDGGTAEAA